MKKLLAFAVLLIGTVLSGTGAASAQPFTPVETNLRTVTFGMLALGDYDGDGYLDVFAADHEFASFHINPGTGGLSRFSTQPPLFSRNTHLLVHNGSVDVGDYDNDGDLDLLFAGALDATLLYRNDGKGSFSRDDVELPGVLKSGMIDVVNAPASTWGDVDNDGDLDVLLVGYVGDRNGPPVSTMYLNEGNGRFTELAVSLPATVTGPPAWGDYDGDGDLDLLAACYCEAGKASTRLFRNGGNGRFADTGTVFLDAVPSATRWGDYDDDGDLDILLSGQVVVEEQVSSSGATRTFVMRPYLALFRNDGGTFRADNQVLPDGTYWADWADLDNDGDLDILVNGVVRDASGTLVPALRVLQNEGGRFGTYTAVLPRIWNGDIAIGDLDNDGDLDLVLSGIVSSKEGEQTPGTLIYRNDAPSANTAPSAPSGLQAVFEGDALTVSWAPATDAETPAAGLQYNLRVGTMPGGVDVVSPMSLPDGTRLAPRDGNAGPNTRWTIRGLDPRKNYYWSVQAIDHALGASAFSAEHTGSVTTAREQDEAAPTRFGLIDNYPNPFNPRTTIRFATDRSGPVRLAVYDVYGRQVAVLQDGVVAAGEHETTFDGAGLPSGVYLCRIVAGSRTDTRSLTLAK